MPKLQLLDPRVESVFGKVSPYRVKMDPAYEAETEFAAVERPFLRVIPCKRGGKVSDQRANIYVHSGTHAGFIGKGVGLRRELLALDGVTPWQTGDQEFSVIFPLEMTAEVAGVVKAIRRRQSGGSKNRDTGAQIAPDSFAVGVQ